MNLNNDFNNHWIAGFSDADASFQIKVVNKINSISKSALASSPAKGSRPSLKVP